MRSGNHRGSECASCVTTIASENCSLRLDRVMAGTMQEIVDEYAARREQYDSVQSCQSAASDCEKWLLDKDVPVTRIVGILASSEPLTLAESDETLPTQQYPCSMCYVLTRGCIWALDDEYDHKRMITGTQHQLVWPSSDAACCNST